MSCHGMALSWSWRSSGRGAEGCTDAKGVARVPGQQRGARVGLSPPNFPAWAQIFSMPARCSTKWPQEIYFRILQKNLVELIHIMFGAEWWWWGAKLSWFAKIQK